MSVDANSKTKACRRRNKRIETAVTHHRQFADQFDFFAKRGNIIFNVFGVLIGEDFEIAKLAAFSAETEYASTAPAGHRRGGE